MVKNKIVPFQPRSLIKRMGGDTALLEAQLPFMIAKMQGMGTLLKEILQMPGKLSLDFLKNFLEVWLSRN